MRDAIMASVYHMFSTDEKPQDQLYPKGPSSWCFYNAAEAKDDVPGPHSIFRHTSSDENLLQEHILPVYRCLTDDALLKRCERHATQNPNESLHNVIWAKHKFYSKKRIELSTVLSISEFNPGPLQMIEIREVLGCGVSEPAVRLAKSRMNTRKRISRKDERERNKKSKGSPLKKLDRGVIKTCKPRMAQGCFEKYQLSFVVVITLIHKGNIILAFFVLYKFGIGV